MRPTRSSLLALAALVLGTGVTGCEQPPVTAVDRETFVRAYVEIRAAALETEDAQPTERQREEILDRYGVTAEDLVEFVEVHGEDVDFMRELWNDIEVRLEVDSLPRINS